MVDLLDASLATELRSLAECYAVGVDRRDPDLFASAFLPDASLVVHPAGSDPTDHSNRREGHAELRTVTDMIQRYARTMHFLGQSLYEKGPEGPVGEVYCIAHHITPSEGETTDYVMHIRYRDRYGAGGDGRWGIAERHVWCDWTETRPVDVPKVVR